MALLLPHHHPLLHTTPKPQLPFLTHSLSLSLSLLTLSMATLQSLTFTSPVSHHLPQHRSNSAFVYGRIIPSASAASSTFNGQSLNASHISKCETLRRRKWDACVSPIVMLQPKIQFIQGTDELTVPDVRLTKSRDGTNGMAIFKFEQPSVFDSSSEVGDITGFYMIDEEGVIQSVDVNAKFINGKPAGIEAKYIMRTPKEWDRFMRFMERYSNANGLQFIKK